MRTKEIVKKFFVVVVAILLLPSNKSVMAAAELSADDFVAKVNCETETWNYFDSLLLYPEEKYGIRGYGYDEAIDTVSKEDVITTSRGINIGSKSSMLIQKYGEGTKITLSEDIVYNGLPDFMLDYFSNTKYVLTYDYIEKTQTDEEYISTIHFYIDDNDEVALIFFSRVLNETEEAAYVEQVTDVDVEEAANTQNKETKIPKTGVNDSMVGIIYLLLDTGALVVSYKLKKFYFEKTNF